MRTLRSCHWRVAGGVFRTHLADEGLPFSTFHSTRFFSCDLSAIPAEDWPSFHCRPSTLSTFLPFSVSIRQTPTTLRNDLGSVPTVSFDRSAFTVCCAATASDDRPSTAENMLAIACARFMTDLHFV